LLQPLVNKSKSQGGPDGSEGGQKHFGGPRTPILLLLAPMLLALLFTLLSFEVIWVVVCCWLILLHQQVLDHKMLWFWS